MSLKASTQTLVLAALIALAGCGEIRSHADFEALVRDKSAAEVEAQLGKPAAVEESDGTVRWTYSGQTFSTEGGSTKFDKKTIVVFRKSAPSAPAKVAEVTYQ